MASEKRRRKESKLRKLSEGTLNRGPVHRDGDRRRREMGTSVRDAIAAKRALHGFSVAREPELDANALDLEPDLDDDDQIVPPEYDALG